MSSHRFSKLCWTASRHVSPLRLGWPGIDWREHRSARLDDFGGVEAEILPEPRPDDLHTDRQVPARPVGTATAGRLSTLTATSKRWARIASSVLAWSRVSNPIENGRSVDTGPRTSGCSAAKTDQARRCATRSASPPMKLARSTSPAVAAMKPKARRIPSSPWASMADANRRYMELDELFASASIVCLHLPSSAETRHMIGATQLAQMQPTAFLINTSRGDLIDEAALREAIVGGRLAGAGLDVVEDEPKEVNPFADLPQVIVTPHTAGISKTSAPRALEQAAANIGRFLRGESVFHLVTRSRVLSRPHE